MPIIYGQVGGFKHYAEQPEYVPRRKAKRAQAENAGNKPWALNISFAGRE